MTAPARITQDDMKCATKAVKEAGFDRARIVMDLAQAKIEIIIGDAGTDSAPSRNTFDGD